MTVEELIHPRSAALLVVDMQNDFCDSRGSLAVGGADPSLIQDMAPRLVRLLESARAIEGLPIIHVRTIHSRWTDSESWLGRLKGRGPICTPDTWGAEYYPGFSPLPSEYVVTKHRYSAFVGTDLEQVLRALGRRSVIMTGEATNVCVESTARDAYMRDFFVAFLSDCTASTSQEAHDATLYTMDKHFGRVMTSDEVIAAWQNAGVLRQAVSA